MNGRVLPFEDRGHRDIALLLPWYANGTLDADEQARVQAHLAACATCRQDLVALEAIIDEGAREAGADALDGAALDRDWQRLRGRLKAARQAPARRDPPIDRWAFVRSAWRGTAPWARMALAAQAALLVVFGAMLFRIERAPVPAVYRTLSATATPASSADRVLVVFDPRITDAQTRALLAQVQARIVDGPNEAGAYLLATRPGQAESVRNALRATPGVAMAELLSPPQDVRR